MNLLFVTLLLQFSAPAHASATFKCAGTPHTIHHIIVNKNATCELSKLYEAEHFCLTDSKGKEIEGIPFPVTPGQNQSFGLIFDDNADFNMEYALTCVGNDGAFQNSPKVIFTIGANGPADPNISVVPLYGAQGTWVSTNVGEDYTCTF